MREYMILRCALIHADGHHARFELFNNIYMHKIVTEHVLLQDMLNALNSNNV